MDYSVPVQYRYSAMIFSLLAISGINPACVKITDEEGGSSLRIEVVQIVWDYESNQNNVPIAMRTTVLAPPLFCWSPSSSSYIRNLSRICLVACCANAR